MGDWSTAAVSAHGEYVRLGSSALASPAASISFTSLSTDYRAWRVTVYGIKDANAGAFKLELNNDTANNYRSQYVDADSTTIAGARDASAASWFINGSGNSAASSTLLAVIELAKPVAAEVARGMMYLSYISNISSNIAVAVKAFEWVNTADLISRIDVLSHTNNLAAGTRVLLEGVQSA